MRPTDADGAADELPEMLTVSEAARRLRIGRTLAYQLAAKFLDGEPDGMPVIRLGGALRVPRVALDDFMRIGRVVTSAELAAVADVAIDAYLGDSHVAPPSAGRPSRSRRAASEHGAQLSLLEAD
jgi:excisionase family DNA binding protein